MSQAPERDMLMVMGDFNARVGNNAEAWHGTLGKFGPSEKNENGVRLLDFCALNDLVVTTHYSSRGWAINKHGSFLLNPHVQAICWIMSWSVLGLDPVF